MKAIHSNRGFTLVEVIVTLVITVIIMCIAVPNMAGYIRRAGNTSVIAECRSTVEAGMLILSERTSFYTSITDNEKNKIMELSGAEGNIKNIKGGIRDVIDYMEYESAGGVIVVYENGKYTVKNSYKTENNTANMKDDTNENEKETEITTGEAPSEETTYTTIKIRDKDNKYHYISDSVILWESMKTENVASFKAGSIYRQGDLFYICTADSDIKTSDTEDLSELQGSVLIKISESTVMYTDDYMQSLRSDSPETISIGDMKYSGEEYYICKNIRKDCTVYDTYYYSSLWQKVDKKYFYMKH